MRKYSKGVKLLSNVGKTLKRAIEEAAKEKEANLYSLLKTKRTMRKVREDGEGVTISDVGKVLKAVSPLIDKIEEEKKAAYFSMLKELKEMRGKRRKSAIKTKRKKTKRRVK